MSLRVRSWVLPLLLCLGCTAKPAPADEKKDAPEAKAAEVKTDDATPPADERKDEPAVGNTKRIEIVSAEPPEITVLEVGTDPRELRLNPVVGETEMMKMTMTMDMTMAPMPAISMPPMVTSMSGVATEVTDERIKATMKFESITIEPKSDTPQMLVDQLKQTLDGFESFESSVELDKRGTLLGGHSDVPQGLPGPVQQTMNQMQESFGKLQVPLPEEAVGLGGKWKAVSNVEQGGMKLEQTATYEVLSFEGDDIELKVDIEQKLVSKEFEPPGMPGVKGSIERYSGGGSGTLALKLDKLTPTRSDMTVDVDMKMTVSAMGQDQTQEMTMKMDIDLVRAE